MWSAIDAGGVICYSAGTGHGKLLKAEAFSQCNGPAKLAELLAMALRSRGHAVDAAHATAEKYDTDTLFLIGSYSDSIIVNWFVRRDTHHAWKKRRVLTMPQARAALLAIMATPADKSSREECERIIGGET